MWGLGDYVREFSYNQCTKQNVQCTKCEKLYYRCYVYDQCPNCGEKEFVAVPWWYGMPVPGNNNIQGKVLVDGRKIVPKFFVEVRANLNPREDDLSSWVNAEEWFQEQGWTWVESEEWHRYDVRIEKWDWEERKIISLTFAID